MKFGKAFSDNVVLERQQRGLFTSSSPSWWLGTGKVLLFATCTVIVFFILFWRLFSLTIINGHTYRMLSDTNRTKQLIVHAPRGEVLDRTGKPLAWNTPYFRLLKPCESDENKLCASKISQTEGETLKQTGVPQKWFLEVDYKRQYALPEALFHTVGYVGEITAEELRDSYYQLRNYTMGDMIGRAGAEAIFEEKLRGKDGKELVEVDAQGGTIRVLGHMEPVNGISVTLALDKGLSEVVASVFPKGETGAVVVSKPTTGEILALYSSPSFSSELLSRGLTSGQYQALLDDPDKPQFNRAIGGVYPPGSVFKLVTSVAGLEERVIKKDTLVEDTGEIKIGAFTFPNWYFKQYGKTDGMVDVVKALQRSNDIFFYKVGEWMGITKLGVWAKKMGVGTILGIELPGEAEGLMPDPKWKDSIFNTPQDKAARNNEWYVGDTYHVSIGQGYLLTTPLQANVWTNVVANGGKLCKPTIVKLSGETSTSGCNDLGIDAEAIALVTEGMKKACQEGGTGYPFFNFRVFKPDTEVSSNADGSGKTEKTATPSGKFLSVPVACKTGTAEFGLSVGSGNLKTHAWFTAFAPLPADSSAGDSAKAEVPRESTITGEPEISVTVLIEGAGEGSDKAAPVAKKIMEAWFTR